MKLIEDFQARVAKWLRACFGDAIAADKAERNHRFLEESLELVQACGCTKSEAHQLVDYVFGRPVGHVNQEVGGAMVTLAALCQAHDVSMEVEGDLELARIWMVIDQVRAKQAAKPKHSPLPSSPAVRYEIQSVRRLAGEVLLRAIEGAEVPQAVESGMSVSLEGIA